MTHQKSAPPIAFAVFLFYLFPLLSLLIFADQSISSSDRWIIWSIGLFAASCGSLGIFWMMRQWEDGWQSMAPEQLPEENLSSSYEEDLETNLEPPPRPPTDIEQEREEYEKAIQEAEAKVAESLKQLNLKNDEVQKFMKDNERYQRQAELVLQEFAQYKKAAQDQLEQKGTLLADYQQTMAEQKAILEKKQHQIAQLETKVQDLTYEIKTLLQLAEIGNQTSCAQSNSLFFNEPGSPFYSHQEFSNEENLSIPEKEVRTFEEASLQLRRCVDIAQKMTGAAHFSSASRVQGALDDHYAIDLRRLYESLRSEKGAAIIFYSQKENKLLFVNSQTKNLLGFSPEKFVQNFPEIVQQGKEEWSKALAQLISQNEVKISLVMKAKTGHDVLVHGALGVIPTGLFKHHIIGILYPA